MPEREELIMEEVQETALTVAEENSMEMSSGIFGTTRKENVRKATSLDLSDESQAEMLLDSMSEVDYKLNDCVDKVINVIGFYATERPVEQFNEDTGETYMRYKHVLILFDENHKSYVTGSNACYMSFNDIVTVKGEPTIDNPLKLKVIKVDAKEKGHSYLKLKLAKEEK